MNRKQQEKLGDLLLDVAKYIITAVLLATWFDDVSNWSRTSYLVPMGAVILTAFAGISLYDHTDQVVEEKKKTADAMLYLVIAASIAILVYVKFGKRDSRGQVR